jgi:hypothetical protein
MILIATKNGEYRFDAFQGLSFTYEHAVMVECNHHRLPVVLNNLWVKGRFYCRWSGQVVTTASHPPLALDSFHFIDFSRPPSLVEPWLQRPIEAQNHEPAFAGNRLHPVALFSFRSFWSEIDIH